MSDSVTARQRRAIEALTAGSTVTAAADAAHVGRATVYAWLKMPTFAQALGDSQREARAAAMRLLSGGLSRAALTVLRLTEHAEDEAVRLRAAQTVPSMLRDLQAMDAPATSPAVMFASGVTVFSHDAAVASIAARAARDARDAE